MKSSKGMPSGNKSSLVKGGPVKKVTPIKTAKPSITKSTSTRDNSKAINKKDVGRS